MRIRKKKWARKELEESKFYTDFPNENKNNWNKVFGNDNPIRIELGCGKGQFISKLASKNLDINYVAIDLIDAMLGLAKRNIEKEYEQIGIKSEKIKNLVLTRYNIEQIDQIFGKADQIDRIYINFCNPWPKPKHHKKRLTNTRQLEKYITFLKPGAKIYFKTDDEFLFIDTLNYLSKMGFELEEITTNLQSLDIFDGNIETEHEKMFKEQGILIKGLIAKWKS